MDFIFQYAGVMNIVFQFIFEPSSIFSRASMVLVLLFAMVKNLFYLRIFDSLSYLVTLITQVSADLSAFLVFYIILCFMFSLTLGVLGFQNYTMLDPEF